jgi:hypothetical protein
LKKSENNTSVASFVKRSFSVQTAFSGADGCQLFLYLGKKSIADGPFGSMDEYLWQG